MKNLPTNEENGEKSRKIIDIVNEKIFQPKLGQRKENRDWWKEERFAQGGTCLRRDLDDKRLGQNKVLCNSSGVKLLMVNYYAGSPAFRKRDRSPPTCRLLTLESHWLRFCLVTSFLLPHLERFWVRPVGHPCFCFRGSVGLTVDLAIGGTKSRGTDVILSFSRWSL